MCVSCGRKKGDVNVAQGEEGGRGGERDEDARRERGKENATGERVEGMQLRARGGRGECGGVERELTPPPRHQIAPQPRWKESGRCCFSAAPPRPFARAETRKGQG